MIDLALFTLACLTAGYLMGYLVAAARHTAEPLPWIKPPCTRCLHGVEFHDDDGCRACRAGTGQCQAWCEHVPPCSGLGQG